MQSTDPAASALLTDPLYGLPTLLPDGSYAGLALGGVGANPCAGVPSQKDIGRCRNEVRKRYTTYLKATLKASQQCRDRVNAGKLAGPCPDSKTAVRLAKAAAKIDPTRLALRCDATVMAASNLGGACATATGTSDLSACIQGAADAAVAAMLDSEYAEAEPTGPLADPLAAKCQQRIGKESGKYAAGRVKILASCQKRLDQGKVATCPDAKAAAKLAKLIGKVQPRLETKCTDTHVANLDALGTFGGTCSGTATTAMLATCERADHDAETDSLIALVQ